MFSAPKTKFDMSAAMDAGHVIIVNNSKDLLGAQGTEFFGRLFIALVLNAAHGRAGLEDHQKKPCFSTL